MKKLKGIINLITLVLTAGLLILVTVAWYATNKTANVTPSVGATAVGKNLFLSTTYQGDSTFVYDENTFSSVWGQTATINASNILIPVSTTNAKDFYYTSSINADGTAVSNEGVYDFDLVTSSTSYYYVSKTVYLCTSEETDMDCCLRNISIQTGEDGTDIYKAVRVAYSYNLTTKIFRYNQTEGVAYPANSKTTISAVDPALNSGGQNDSVFTFPIIGASTTNDVTTYTVTAVNVLIWVEGQNSNALATYAGKGFRISMSFQTY